MCIRDRKSVLRQIRYNRQSRYYILREDYYVTGGRRAYVTGIDSFLLTCVSRTPAAPTSQSAALAIPHAVDTVTPRPAVTSLRSVAAVSYTHLDVYKRQI